MAVPICHNLCSGQYLRPLTKEGMEWVTKYRQAAENVNKIWQRILFCCIGVVSLIGFKILFKTPSSLILGGGVVGLYVFYTLKSAEDQVNELMTKLDRRQFEVVGQPLHRVDQVLCLRRF